MFEREGSGLKGLVVFREYINKDLFKLYFVEVYNYYLENCLIVDFCNGLKFDCITGIVLFRCIF